MANNFWFKFYFKEWADDVKPLSLAARGLLIELIIHLRKSGGSMPVDVRLISRLTGALTEEINFAMVEFRDHNIFDFEKTDDGEILRSRKILKEIAKSLVNKENGKKGGSPLLKPSVKRNKKKKDNQIDNPTSNSDFNSDSYFDLKKRYGSRKNILLSESEVAKLKTDFPVDAEDAIEYLSTWAIEKPKNFKEYKDHNLAIRRWVIDAVQEKRQKAIKNSGIGKTAPVTNQKYGT